MKTIGTQIAVLRKHNGWTQEKFAEQIGVSTQSVSKWETGTTMPDISLLPIIASAFGVTIDTLFGNAQKKGMRSEEIPEESERQVLHTLFSCLHDDSAPNSYQNELSGYMTALKNDPRNRTAVIHRHGGVYHRDALGSLLIKRPEKGWHSLLADAEQFHAFRLLRCAAFVDVIGYITQTGTTRFILSALCRKCGVEYTAELEQMLDDSGMFVCTTVDTGDEELTVYEIGNTGKWFMLLATLALCREFEGYQNHYYGYIVDSEFCMD